MQAKLAAKDSAFFILLSLGRFRQFHYYRRNFSERWDFLGVRGARVHSIIQFISPLGIAGIFLAVFLKSLQ